MEKKIVETLKGFYPDFPDQVVGDLAHLLYGNAQHVKMVIEKNGRKFVEINHQEKVVCLGNFDWLYLHNFALIVNPRAKDTWQAFETELKILRSNLVNGRISAEQGMLVMISSSYRHKEDEQTSILRACGYLENAQQIIVEKFQDLLEAGLQVIVGTTDENTRLFKQLKEEDLASFSECNYKTPEKLNSIGEFVLKYNRSQSNDFIRPENKKSRRMYRKEHPTEILVLKCMDGRVHFAIAMQIAMGLLKILRHVGGKFNFDHNPFFLEVKNWVNYCQEKRKGCLILATYHFSSMPGLCCAGQNHSRQVAEEYAIKLAAQGKRALNNSANIIVAGYNTDNDSITVHGPEDGQLLEIEKLAKELLKKE